MNGMKKRFTAFEITAVSVAAVVVAAWITMLGVFIAQAVSDKHINDSFENFLKEDRFQTAVSVEEIKSVTQTIKCEYAVIEMLSKWRGGSETEESLSEKTGKAIMSANDFADELGHALSPMKVEVHKRETNSALLERIYLSLERGMPVPVQLASQNESSNKKDWYVHYVLVVAMDVRENNITAINPFGYERTYKIEDFLKSTRFDNFEKMTLEIEFGFAFGIFQKNTVYILSE